jgi:tyrosine-protein phosphatase SIW14
MRKMLPVVLGFSVFALMIAAPICYERWHDHQYRNFHVVEEGVLYRGGQFPLPRLQEIVQTHKIRTVICLREGDKLDDQAEETWVKARGLNFVRIPPRTWWPEADGKTPGDQSIAEFRKVMEDPTKHPVLVHCFAGIHRTGMMCAVYRMDYQGWTNDEAMAEMRTMGYTILDDHEDIFAYLIRYRSPYDRNAVQATPTSFKKNPRP